jgi:hypothetical protein
MPLKLRYIVAGVSVLTVTTVLGLTTFFASAS